MDFSLVFLLTALNLGLFFLGLFLGKRRERWALLAIAVATMFLIGRALVHNFFSELESQLARFSTYAQIHAWWPFLPASLWGSAAGMASNSVKIIAVQ